MESVLNESPPPPTQLPSSLNDTISKSDIYKESLNTPYKVVLLNATGVIEQIILFLGENEDESVWGDADLCNDNDSYRASEMCEGIKTISTQAIHKDDSIRIVKKKILMELSKQGISVAYDEIYLFGQQTKTTHLIEIYQDITENDTIPITKPMIAQLLVNFDIPDLGYIVNAKLLGSSSSEGTVYSSKSTYTYEDLSGIDVFDKPNTVDIPIGFQFTNRRNLLFSSNPYNILGSFDLVQPDDVVNPLISMDNQLLLNYGLLSKNTIFVCLAENTFQYAIENNISQEYIARTYYPFLGNRDIISKPELEKQRPAMIREMKNIMTPGSFGLYRQIDMMYDIYFTRLEKANLKYSAHGIRKFSIILTGIKHNLPLETIFKNIHTSLQVPFIKYNPGSKQENIYRLYCDRVSKNGRKIPFLPDSTIMKLSREMGKSMRVGGGSQQKRLSLYFRYSSIKHSLNELFLEFERSGMIRIYGESKEPVDEDVLSEIIRTLVTPVIDTINGILRPSGYLIQPFVDLRQENVKVMNMSYEWQIQIDKKLDLANYRGCLSGIFDITEEGANDIERGIITRFKRVENFREMDAQFAFINEIFQQGGDRDEVLNRLMENYGLTEEQAILQLTNFIHETTEVNGKIMENPGFPVLLQIPSGKMLHIQVDNILSLDYIDVLFIYFDSILRMTQFPKSIPSDIMKMINTCKKSKIIVKDVTHVENVIAPIILDKPTILEPITYGYEEEEEDDDIERFLNFNESDEEDEEESMEGGNDGQSPEEFEGILDGLSLHKPNPFEKRLKRLDPVLFTTKLNGKYENYSQLCNSNINRQPVVLSDKEKEAIDRLHPGSYEHAIQYGTDENHQNWYICPRYWCLKNNMSMTEEDVRQGKCAKVPKPGSPGEYLPDEIIPEIDPKTNKPTVAVPKGKYVYEFKSQKEHVDKDGNYIPHYPGFLKEGLHPAGHCLPCCFKQLPKFKKNKKGEILPDNEQAERQTHCSAPPSSTKKTKKVVAKDAQIDYIKNASFFPLEENRFGYLPIAMQLFLQIDANTSVDKNNPAIIQEKKTALLRMGVESSENQSFIASIANIYSNIFGVSMTIAEMRDKIAKAVSLDRFVTYHNASLISTFRPKMIEQGKYSVEEYENTDFVRRLEAKTEDYYDMIIETIASYENFLSYLSDETAIIDYTHLWDIVTDKNDLLFPSGLNMVILESANHDITDNVNLICPTNHYSNNIYNPAKPTIILIKQQNYYEPVYVYYYENVKSGVQVKIQKTLVGFFLKDSTPQKYDEEMHGAKTYIRELTMKVNRVLEIIQKSTNKLCKPKSSMPRIYHFIKNITAEEIYKILVSHGYTVDMQVLNYQQNVIGLVASKPEIRLTGDRIPLDGHFVPCFPSSILRKGPSFLNTPLFTSELKSVMMDEDDLWKDYSLTIAGLNAIKRDTNGQILCAPHSKVIEDNLVVGILTETNQFLLLDPPSENIADDGLHVIRGSNYIVAEKELVRKDADEPLSERDQKIKDIALESTFFSSFRALIRRYLVDSFENRHIRKKMTDILNNIYFTYREKLRKIADILLDVTKDAIQFCEVNPKVMAYLTNVADLYSNIHTSDSGTICLASEDKSKIHFPKKHLISGLDNETAYFMRVADEIIRNKRIQTYMLNSKYYLNTNKEYSVNPDELILLQSLLTYEYFEGLIPQRENKYIDSMNYITAEPFITQTYSNTVALEEQYQMNQVDMTAEQEAFELQSIKNPNPQEQTVVGNLNKRDNIWNRASFPSYAKELIMKADVPSTFYPIIYIVYKITGEWHTVDQMRQKLLRAYTEYMDLHQPKIFDIWRNQGKYRMAKAIEDKKTTWQDVILSEEYGFSNLDLWILCDFYNIPVILFSSTKNKLLNLGISPTVDWIVLNMSKGTANLMKTNYFFVRGTGTKDPRVIASFHLIKPSIRISEMRNLNKYIQTFIHNPVAEEYTNHLSSLEDHFTRYQIKEMIKLNI